MGNALAWPALACSMVCSVSCPVMQRAEGLPPLVGKLVCKSLWSVIRISLQFKQCNSKGFYALFFFFFILPCSTTGSIIRWKVPPTAPFSWAINIYDSHHVSLCYAKWQKFTCLCVCLCVCEECVESSDCEAIPCMIFRLWVVKSVTVMYAIYGTITWSDA